MGGTLYDHLRQLGVNPLGLSRDEAYKELDRQSRLALKMSQVENEKFRGALTKEDMVNRGALPFGQNMRISNNRIVERPPRVFGNRIVDSNRIAGSPFIPPQPVPEVIRWLRGQVEEICSLGRGVGV